ncbi:MAG: hypothetical protein PWP65_2072 [Clostridia bacterium]|nr:hypothetical protein [Clostridia bacterium]
MHKSTDYCFACGSANPIGLRLQFRDEGEACVCELIPGEYFQGWQGMLHGGIIATLLDEVMAHWCFRRGHMIVTAELSVRFRKPVPIGQKLRVWAKAVGQKHKVFFLEAVLEKDGEILAEGKGKLVEV